MSDLVTRLRMLADTAQAVREIKRVGAEHDTTTAKLTKAPGPTVYDKVAAAAGRAAERQAAAAKKIADAEAREAKRAADAKEREAKRAAAAAEAAAAKQATSAKLAADRELAEIKRTSDLKQRARDRDAAAAERSAKREAASKVRQERARITGIAPQLTDIVTSLQGGQNPFTVLLQQGGQLRDMFGGIGPMLKGLATVFTPLRVAALGVVGALASIGTLLVKGALESDRLNKSFALTGNTMQYTTSAIDRQSAAIVRATGVTIGAAREIVNSVAASNQYTVETGASVAQAIAATSVLSEKAAEDLSKDFELMLRNATDGAAKINSNYNILSVAQFKQIRMLKEQGRAQEAIGIVADAQSAAIKERTIPALGALERAWLGVSRIVSEALDWVKSFGREESAEQRIEGLARSLERLRAVRDAQTADPNQTNARNPYDTEVAAAEEALATARETERERKQFAARRASEQRATNEEIQKLAKDHQASLSQIDDAAAAKQLANALRSIARKADALEREHARGLLSERTYTDRLNALEIERLEAQRTAAQRRIAAASRELVPGGKTAEQNAIRARITQQQAALVEAETQLESARSKRLADGERSHLDEAREAAQAYSEVWKRAYDQVQALALQAQGARASRIKDPLERANAEARVQTADLERQRDELLRDLVNTRDQAVDPEVRGELQRKIDALLATANEVIEDRTSRSVFASLASQADLLPQVLAEREAEVNARIAAGTTTAADGERELLDLRRQQLPALEAILRLMEAMASTDEEQARVLAIKAQVTAMRDVRTEMEKTARSSAIDAWVQFWDDMVTSSKSFKEAALDAVRSFAQAMLNVLQRRIAEKLVDGFLKAMDSVGSTGGGSAGGGDGGLWASIIKLVVGLFHTGGVVGSGGGQKRAVSPAAFAFAPRYHSGNTGDLVKQMGLRRGEVPAVLMQGEEVLTETDPRHVKNYRGGGGVVVQATTSVTVNGSQGDPSASRAAGQQLQGVIDQAINQWAQRETRPGGILAKMRTA